MNARQLAVMHALLDRFQLSLGGGEVIQLRAEKDALGVSFSYKPFKNDSRFVVVVPNDKHEGILFTGLLGVEAKRAVEAAGVQ